MKEIRTPQIKLRKNSNNSCNYIKKENRNPKEIGQQLNNIQEANGIC